MEKKFTNQAVCPNCGGLDAGMDAEGNVLCYSCGYFPQDEIKKYKGVI